MGKVVEIKEEKISSAWTASPDGRFELQLTIPANASADVYLPAKSGASAFEDGKKLNAEVQDGAFFVPVGSGTYVFEVR